jgi:ectoine hydroxylase-related dioxygenase (phytanoyl-CoA dioxygenase family)
MEQLEKHKTNLKENGWTVIPNVLTSDEAEQTKVNFIKFLCSLKKDGSLKYDDQKTWKGNNWMFNSNGIIQHYGVGHSQVLWDVRQNENVIKIFQTLHESSELLTSFDGGCVIRSNVSKFKPKYHTDQSPQVNIEDPEFVCYQGVLALTDCGINDGGLVVYEKSHLTHANYFEKNNLTESKKNWHVYYDVNQISKKKRTIEGETKREIGKTFLDQHKKIKVCCKKGDLMLFDSKTAHAVTFNDSGKMRVALYICMLPKKYSNEKELELRKKAFFDFRTSSHWPCKYFEPFQLAPRFKGKEFYNVDNKEEWSKLFKPKLTNKMLELVGFDEKEIKDILQKSK